MLWLNQSKRIWRVAILILLLVAISGPWGFDRINVPAQYACTTAVRLYGDFCGMPVSGMWMPVEIIRGFIPMIVELLTGTSTYQIRDLFIGLIMLLPVLPFISSSFMILERHYHRWQVFHITALGLAVSFALFIGVNLMSDTGFSRVWWLLWGLWLFIGVTVSALALEALAFMRDRETRRGI